MIYFFIFIVARVVAMTKCCVANVEIVSSTGHFCSRKCCDFRKKSEISTLLAVIRVFFRNFSLKVEKHMPLFTNREIL